MISKTPFVAEQIRKLPEIQDRVDYLWGKYSEEDCVILAAGPSLKKYPIHNYFIHKKNALDEVNLRNLINDNYQWMSLTNANELKSIWSNTCPS